MAPPQPPVLARIPLVAGSAEADDTGDFSLHRADWPAAEGLFGRLGDLGDPAVVLVTAPQAGVPVRVAASLAAAASIAGRRTLVVECDLARPALADMVGLSPVPGLREYLCWAADAPELLQPVSVGGPATEGRAGIGQLVFITAGRAASNGGALLSGESLPAVLRKVRKAYDLVLLPAGPLGSPELGPAARLSDAALVCLGWDPADRPLSESTEGAIAALPPQPAAVVVCEELRSA